MIFNKRIRFFLAACALCVSANAATVFNFDGDSLGTSTSFTDTVDGLSATFSSPADPGGFIVYASMFSAVNGHVIGDPGPAGANNLALSITFSQNIGALTLDFATADFGSPSPLTLTAYENSNLVGSASATGNVPGGFLFPEGQVSFNGGTFNQLVVSSSAPDFAVDNINATAAPEPAPVALFGVSLLAFGIPALRRRSTRVAAAE
jgi:hypothetical protein